MALFPDKVIDMCKVLPTCQSVLIRGPHGIGKSQIARVLGMILDRPVIDLRLSQMTEGDFLGLPKIVEPEYDNEGNVTRHGMTEFRPPWWFVKAMTVPVILLLDEINRAVPEVMQCAFQLVLDRAIQGKSIHPDTIILAAVNATHHYQVNEMDPALLSRFLTVDMVPHISTWKKWAEANNIDSSIIEFCVQHTDHWWYDPGKGLEPGKVYPDPRAWEMLHNCFKEADLFNQVSNPTFRHIAMGLVGIEAGEAYYSFMKNYDRNITAEQILDKYETIQGRVKSGLSAEQIMAVTDKLVNHSKSKKWKKAQVLNLRAFMSDIDNGELVFSMWNRINGASKESKHADANTMKTHELCSDIIFGALSRGAGTT